MHYVVAGIGYTGRRVFDRLPVGRRSGLSRTPRGDPKLRELDLDRDSRTPIEPPLPWMLLYTVPPRQQGGGDARLSRLLDNLRTAPQRIVYVSTSGVYGDRGGRMTDEHTPPAPESNRAKRRLAAETLLTDWCRDRGVDLMILRVPGIYGPGRLGLDRLRAGEPVLREVDSGPGNRIHVDDLAACCVAAMTTDVPAGASACNSWAIGKAIPRSPTTT